MSSDRTVGVDAVGVVIVPPCLCIDLHRCFVAVVGPSSIGVFDGALAQRWTDTIAFCANFPCQTSNVTLRRIGARLACRIGAAACQKRREWGLIAGGDLGLSPISNSANLSHLVFCENIACEPHYCSCIRALNFVISGPIVAFSANSGSIICNEAPLWHFLPTSFAERFR